MLVTQQELNSILGKDLELNFKLSDVYGQLLGDKDTEIKTTFKSFDYIDWERFRCYLRMDSGSVLASDSEIRAITKAFSNIKEIWEGETRVDLETLTIRDKVAYVGLIAGHLEYNLIPELKKK